MRYWKVYRKDVKACSPILEITESRARDYIDNEVWNREEDYMEHIGSALKMFETLGAFGCGDFMICRCNEKPERPENTRYITA